MIETAGNWGLVALSVAVGAWVLAILHERRPQGWFRYGYFEGKAGGYILPEGLIPIALYRLGNCCGRISLKITNCYVGRIRENQRSDCEMGTSEPSRKVDML